MKDLKLPLHRKLQKHYCATLSQERTRRLSLYKCHEPRHVFHVKSYYIKNSLAIDLYAVMLQRAICARVESQYSEIL